jgi:hypothetical protein
MAFVYVKGMGRRGIYLRLLIISKCPLNKDVLWLNVNMLFACIAEMGYQ